MNIADASIKLGLALKLSNEGKELYQSYYDAKNSISHESWDIFEKVNKSLRNYYGYNYAYQIIEANNNKGIPEYLVNQITEILGSEKIKKLSEKSLEFANSIDKTIINLFGLIIPKKFENIYTTPKMRRTLRDLYVCIQNTGITKVILKYGTKPEFQELISIYEESRRSLDTYPFGKKARKLITELHKENYNIEWLYFIETFISINEIIKQIIFEAHMGFIINLSEDEVLNCKVIKRGSLMIADLNLLPSRFDVMNYPGKVCEFIHDNKKYKMLITSKRFSFGTDKDAKLKIKGMGYPINDFSFD
jgi:hypothetical protein